MINQILNNVKNLHINIAKDVWPKGVILRCKLCEKEEKLSSEQCAKSLSEGWPKHCDKEMLMEEIK